MKNTIFLPTRWGKYKLIVGNAGSSEITPTPPLREELKHQIKPEQRDDEARNSETLEGHLKRTSDTIPDNAVVGDRLKATSFHIPFNLMSSIIFADANVTLQLFDVIGEELE